MQARALAISCTEPDRRMALAQHLLTELHRALAEIEQHRKVIARLEAGERRFACRKCGVTVWTKGTEPPPSWTAPNVRVVGPSDYYCQDCQAFIDQGAASSLYPVQLGAQV